MDSSKFAHIEFRLWLVTLYVKVFLLHLSGGGAPKIGAKAHTPFELSA